MKRPRIKPRDADASGRRPAVTERTLLQAQLPGADGLPLLSFRLEMTSEPQGEGERVRLRAHVQTTLGNAAIDAPQSGRKPLGGYTVGSLPARRVAALLQRGLTHPLARRLAAPLLRHDLHTWMEFHASTAPLARGAAALLPSSDALARIGVELPPGDGPLAQTWAGETHGPRAGYAQFSLLRFDKRHLPPALASLLGKRPFQLVAALASVVEQHSDAPSPK